MGGNVRRSVISAFFFCFFSLIAGRIILRLTVRATQVHYMIYQFDGFPIKIYI